MQNCKWEYINYRENTCECDECIEKMWDECDLETEYLENIDIE